MANVSKKKNLKSQNKTGLKTPSRLFPVFTAGIICTLTAVFFGYGAWYFFSVKANGLENRQKLISGVTGIFTTKQKEKPAEMKSAEPEKQPEVVSPTVAAIPTPAEPLPATEQVLQPMPTEAVVAETEKKEETSNPEQPIIEGVVFVKGGETVIGGGKTERAVQRRIVGDFYIAETEVTNKQYAEFIAETKRKPPVGWNNKGFPKGLDVFPVTNITYDDADSFCKWLSKKLNAEVRLPTEFEWEHAAKGNEEYLYPWGNDWDKNAAVVNGKVGSVKKFEKNKSPYGAYDMAGNVWELTSDVELNSKQKPLYTNGQLGRIIRGGSAAEESKDILVTTRWYSVPESKIKSNVIGFRYVVVKPSE
jgi:formylglycine-generating enzyme required for sulfatase activity